MIGFLAHQPTPSGNAPIALLFAGLWVGWVGLDRVRGTGFHRLPRWGGFSFLSLGVVLLNAAVVVPELMTDRAPAPAGPRPRSTARVAILEPRSAQVITGDTFRIRIEVQDGTVVDATSTDLRADTGHVHVSLDGRLLTMTYGADEEFDASGLEPGQHVLEVEFVAADHAPFQPRVIERVTFEKGASS